jgi:hypothetical protein
MHIEKVDSPNPKLDLINLATYFFSYKEEGHLPKLVALGSYSFSYQLTSSPTRRRDIFLSWLL